MSNRRGDALVALTVFVVSVAMRMLPLHWTPLPYNVDGFHFAALARTAGATGHLSAASQLLNPDEYVLTAYLAAVSQATGIEPLGIAQFLVAIIGTVPALTVIVLIRHVCERLEWKPSHARLAALLAGLILAFEGVYLGRSAAVSSEMLGHALVILSALAFYRALRTERPAWMALTLAFVVALPVTHNLSSMIGALVLLAIFVRALKNPTRRRIVFGSTVLVLFWTYMLVYYYYTGLTAAGYITELPGLFLAWVIFLVVLAQWLPSAGTVVQRFVPAGVVVGVVALLVANHFLPIFPGSASTAPLQLAFLIPVASIGLVAAWALPKLSGDEGVSAVVVGLLVGPLALIGFAMTSNLTHEYEALAVRGQIFVHFALGILAAIGAVEIGYRRGSASSLSVARQAVVPLVVLCILVSAPFAFTGLHATSAQPTVTSSEFATGTFASNHIEGGWLSDGHIAFMSSRYYPYRTSVQYTPLYQWLHGGGSSPNCPVVAQRSWTTVGAQVFPSSPVRINTQRYERWTARRDVVYSASGRDPLVVTMPRGTDDCPVEPGDRPASALGPSHIESENRTTKA
ncbi:sodium/phosphate symporter [Haladaptatus caseinilyticus]|uniref:sodium/phosphate symporter n=1 Tax=Haladaptatus caseinilyticus TaxID=2993314 RepID=UPI00224B014E|nr:sodium/phosphate symporter [Haladaptatus caseinilyticus]